MLDFLQKEAGELLEGVVSAPGEEVGEADARGDFLRREGIAD